ncbi:hypothetical protein C8T65DRAFT_262289 [Cerioporus squamosus]|nr:hypothetical protein C8T65DRAFT_262289 [Cerioporus squamosus]
MISGQSRLAALLVYQEQQRARGRVSVVTTAVTVSLSINQTARHAQAIFLSPRLQADDHIPVQCMVSMYYPLIALSTTLFASAVHADVTIYGLLGQTTAAPVQTGTATGTTQLTATTSFVTDHGPPRYTELAAYNPIYMEPPAIPNPPPANQFAIGVPSDATLMNALSIKQSGTFFGFSIEMSVVNQLIGSSP